MLEWLAPALDKVGGVLVQAEDELSSINQIIGAAFGGGPALTATSGPGLALMMESLGLAVAAEIPIRTTTTAFPLDEANRALKPIKDSAIDAAAILKISD